MGERGGGGGGGGGGGYCTTNTKNEHVKTLHDTTTSSYL